jgi:hypothetical protein
MTLLTTKYADCLAGGPSGFDRLVFRGTLRRLAYLAALRPDPLTASAQPAENGSRRLSLWLSAFGTPMPDKPHLHGEETLARRGASHALSVW